MQQAEFSPIKLDQTAYHVELALPLRVSRRWVGRGLKKLKLTHKKNDNVPRKRRLL